MQQPKLQETGLSLEEEQIVSDELFTYFNGLEIEPQTPLGESEMEDWNLLEICADYPWNSSDPSPLSSSSPQDICNSEVPGTSTDISHVVPSATLGMSSIVSAVNGISRTLPAFTRRRVRYTKQLRVLTGEKPPITSEEPARTWITSERRRSHRQIVRPSSSVTVRSQLALTSGTTVMKPRRGRPRKKPLDVNSLRNVGSTVMKRGIGRPRRELLHVKSLRNVGTTVMRRGIGRPRKEPLNVKSLRNNVGTTVMKRGIGRPRKESLNVKSLRNVGTTVMKRGIERPRKELLDLDVKSLRNVGATVKKRGIGRPRKEPLNVISLRNVGTTVMKRGIGRPRKQPLDVKSLRNVGTTVMKLGRGRPRKRPLEVNCLDNERKQLRPRSVPDPAPSTASHPIQCHFRIPPDVQLIRRSLKCYCGFESERLPIMKMHIGSFVHGPIYGCSNCGKMYFSFRQLAGHRSAQDSKCGYETKFFCGMCKENFCNVKVFNLHKYKCMHHRV